MRVENQSLFNDASMMKSIAIATVGIGAAGIIGSFYLVFQPRSGTLYRTEAKPLNARREQAFSGRADRRRSDPASKRN